MKKSTLNKVLAGTLALALCVPMLLASPVQVKASSVSDNVPSGSVSDNVPSESVSGNSSSSSSSSTSSQTAETTVTAKNTVALGGKLVKSTVGGVFAGTVVNGTAVLSPVASVASAAGLSQADVDAGTNVRFYVCNSTNKEAKGALKTAAADAGKNLVGYLNVDMYTITKKGVVTSIKNATAPITLTFALPGRIAKAENKVSIMCIDKDGKTVVMEDTDTDPKTLTVEASVFGVYAIVY